MCKQFKRGYISKTLITPNALLYPKEKTIYNSISYLKEMQYISETFLIPPPPKKR